MLRAKVEQHEKTELYFIRIWDEDSCSSQVLKVTNGQQMFFFDHESALQSADLFNSLNAE